MFRNNLDHLPQSTQEHPRVQSAVAHAHKAPMTCPTNNPYRHRHKQHATLVYIATKHNEVQRSTRGVSQETRSPTTRTPHIEQAPHPTRLPQTSDATTSHRNSSPSLCPIHLHLKLNPYHISSATPALQNRGNPPRSRGRGIKKRKQTKNEETSNPQTQTADR